MSEEGRRKPKRKSPPRIEANVDRFCREMAADGDMVRAFRAAGYRSRIGDDAYARRKAEEILQRTGVRTRIKKYQQERNQAIAITGEKVLSEISYIAFSTMEDVLASTDPVRLKPKEEIPYDAWAGIKAIRSTHVQRVGEDGEPITRSDVSVTMHSKDSAQRLLANSMGLISDQDSAIAAMRRLGFNILKIGPHYVMIDSYVQATALNANQIEVIQATLTANDRPATLGEEFALDLLPDPGY